MQQRNLAIGMCRLDVLQCEGLSLGEGGKQEVVEVRNGLYGCFAHLD